MLAKEVEIWKKVIGFGGSYEVSNLGNVRSLGRMTKKGFIKGRLLKQWNNNNKYPRVSLQDNSKSHSILVHRLVAQSFIPNPLEKPFVNHKNGIKHDNRVENLEWVTANENMRHAYDTGLMEAVHILKGVSKENRWYDKLDQKQYLMIYTLYKNGFSSKDIAKQFDIHPTTALLIFKKMNISKELEVSL